MVLLKLQFMLPLFELPWPTLADSVCEVGAMIFYQECWLTVEMV